MNNAGVATHVNTEEISLAYWREVPEDQYFTAAFLCCREAVGVMKNQTPRAGA